MSLRIYDTDDIKKWDAFTILHEPVKSVDLMERAAGLCTRQILATNLFRSATILCGIGNNGGDGLVIARLLHQRNIAVNVVVLYFSDTPSADFSANLARLPKAVKVQEVRKKTRLSFTSELIVDAIFGSGLNREPSGWVADIIDQVNQAGIKTVAVDIPSGLFATDNRKNSLRHVIRAGQTITFQGPKMAFLYADYADFTGDFKVLDIGLSADFKNRPLAHYVVKNDVLIRERKTFSHKGSHGFLVIAGGFAPYYGAGILAARAAFRTGCGYVASLCDESAFPVLVQALPECIHVPGNGKTWPAKTTAIAIGPGLGTNQQALRLVKKALASGQPLVIDADALNLLSGDQKLQRQLPQNSILTPHPGELERLLGRAQCAEQMLEKQIRFSKKYNVFIIQKGAYSKLTTPSGDIFVNSSGNPGMATAGMGDVLTGIIGSFLAQGYDAHAAAINGMFIHGYAADLVKRQQGERGMLASDVINAIPQVLNQF